MRSTVKKAILAAALGLSAFVISVPAATTASAASLAIEATPAGYRHGYHGPKRHWVRDRGYRGRCAKWLAVDKARARGIRHARILKVTPYKVVVDGQRHHRYARITFANAPRCPVLWR